MQTRLAWYHFILHIPASWEVIAYKTNSLDGRLILCDHLGETMRVHWKARQASPDLTRRLVDVVTEQTDGAMSSGQIREYIYEIHGWQAFAKHTTDLHGMACRCEKEEDALLYVVFPRHPDTVDRACIDDVLRSFEPNYGEDRVWAAFGLDVSIPAAMDIARVDVFPASQVMRFQSERGESVTVHRYGMMSHILAQDDLATHFARTKGRRPFLYSDGKFRKDDKYPGVRLSYTTRGRGGIEGFMARTWQGRVLCWRCDDIERVYYVDNNAAAKNLLPDLAARVREVGGCTKFCDQEDLGEGILDRQLRSVPVVNELVRRKSLDGGKKFLIAPLAHKRWSRIAKRILPIREERKYELDAFSDETFSLLDGKRTVAFVIEHYMTRWRLSFCEARLMILQFLRGMVKKHIIALVVPGDDEDSDSATSS